VYSALLLTLSSDFRREHGEECVALFRRMLRDGERDGGRKGAVRAIWVGWTGALKGAGEDVRERWSGGDSPSPMHADRDLATRARTMPVTETILRETRHALRRLVRSPGFTVPAALTLALAVGAVTATFAVARAVVLAPLPYPDAHRLIWLDHGSRVLGRSEGMPMTHGFYVQYRERASTLESIAIHGAMTVTVTGDGEPERLTVLRATSSLARVVRVSPGLGRWFTEEEAEPGATQVVVLGHGFWERRYGRDPGVVGRTITLSDTPYEIVGVMPPGFAYPERWRPEAWVPLQLRESNIQVSGFNYGGVARLSEDATVEDAAAELDRLIALLPERFPDDAFGLPFIEEVKPFAVPKSLKDFVLGTAERTLWILLGAAAVVLLVACANVANLFLVRAGGRQREMAVRRAMGAGRSGVPALLLSESLLLSLIGGAAGLALAVAGVELLTRLGPQDLPRLDEVRVDALVVAFTVGVSLLVGLAFGSAPLLRRTPLASTLNESGRGSTASPGRMRVRHGLMGAQVALSLVLLIASALMATSFQRLLEVDPGFSEESVLALGVSLPNSRYPTREEAAAFHGRLLERVRALPGVVAASATTCPPLAGLCWQDPVVVEGRERREGEVPPMVSRRRVADRYFETMGMPALAGRLFEGADHRSPTRVAVIDERLAQLYFPGEDPIGQRVWPDVMSTSDPDWYEVIGVVPHVVTSALTSPERPPQLYVPLVSHSTGGTPEPHSVHLVARTATPPLDLVPAVRAALAELDPGLALGRITTLEEILARDRAPMAFTMTLILIAGGAALALGLVGIYGVLSFVVSQRTGEIGVRMALGARSSDIAHMVLRQGGAVALVGLAAGVAAALLASRLVEALLFEVSPTDPTTYAAVATGLFVVSLLACWLPARRAARLDAVVALRAE
jgi:predicted permease